MAWHTEFAVCLTMFVAFIVRYAFTAFICPNCAAPISSRRRWLSTTYSCWRCETCEALLCFSSTRRLLRFIPLGLFISVFLINQAVPVIVPSVIPKNVFIAFGILALMLPFLVTDKLEGFSESNHDAPLRR